MQFRFRLGRKLTAALVAITIACTAAAAAPLQSSHGVPSSAASFQDWLISANCNLDCGYVLYLRGGYGTTFAFRLNEPLLCFDGIGTVSGQFPFDLSHPGWNRHYAGKPVYQIKPCNSGSGCLNTEAGDNIVNWEACDTGACQTCIVQNGFAWISVFGTDAFEGDYSTGDSPYGLQVNCITQNCTLYYSRLADFPAVDTQFVATGA